VSGRWTKNYRNFRFLSFRKSPWFANVVNNNNPLGQSSSRYARDFSRFAIDFRSTRTYIYIYRAYLRKLSPIYKMSTPVRCFRADSVFIFSGTEFSFRVLRPDRYSVDASSKRVILTRNRFSVPDVLFTRRRKTFSPRISVIIYIRR